MPYVTVHELDPRVLDDVVVFLLRYELDAEPGESELARLTAEERARLSRFRRREDRVRYGGARATVRSLLGQRLGLAPLDVPITVGSMGKPVLDERLGVHFNVSHSGEYGLVAITETGEVGVDIEAMRNELAHREIAERVFHPLELAELDALESEASRLRRFFRGWAYKEAVLKAVGVGLSGAPRSFAVVGAAPCRLVADASAFAIAPERVRLVAVPAPEGYAAALAVIGRAEVGEQ